MFLFPFSTLHELNLDWILAKMKHLLSTEEENNRKADYAVETAEEAKTIAEQAAQAQIADGAVTTVKIADGAVTSSKINDGAISGAKLGAGVVTTSKIGDNAVTTPKINDGAVTENKLSANVKNLIFGHATLFLCDSYGTGTGGGLPTTPFCDLVATKLGLTANVDYFKVARGGASLGYNNGAPGDPDTGLNFVDLAAYAINTMTAEQRNSITTVMVCGGINDYQYTYSDIATGAQNLKSYLYTYFPNSKYKFACIGMSLNTNIRRTYLQDTVVNLYNACTNYGISFGICYTPMNYNKNLFHTDGTHPTQLGQNALARSVFDWYNGYDFEETATYSFSTPLGLGFLQLAGNHYILHFNALQQTYDTPFNISATWTDLGAITSNQLVGDTAGNATTFLVTGSIRSNGTWYNNAYIECKLVQASLTEVHMYARSVFYITGTNTYNPYPSISNFLPAPITVELPLAG